MKASTSPISRFGRLSIGLLALIALGSISSGCVYRRLSIQSDPPGALVMIDGEEVGYTPHTGDFTYYGTREITLIKPGYETLTVMQPVKAPWYQYPGVDFVAENLSPFQVTNRRSYFYKMQPQRNVPSDELLDRGNSHRSETQVGP